MRVATPGLRFSDASAAPVVGVGARGKIGIVVAESFVLSNVLRWFPGKRYDVLLVESLHTIYGVPVLGGGGGGGLTSVETSDLAVANSAAVANLLSGRGGDLSALGGAWVVLGELDGGIPVISSTILTPGTKASRIVDNAASPDESSTEGADGIADMATNTARQFADWMRAATPDNEYGANLLSTLIDQGTIPATEAKYPGAPPPKDAAETDSEGRGDAHYAGWERGVVSAYLGTDYGAYTDPQRVSGEVPESVLLPAPDDGVDSGDIDADNRILKSAYVNGFRAGWLSGTTLAARYPRPVAPLEPAPSEAVNEETSDPADEADADNGLVPVSAKGAAKFIEQGGTRIAHTRDGNYRVDSRNGGGEIRFQGGQGGVKSVANGARMEVGTGGDKINATASAVRLGTKDGVEHNVAVWDEGVKEMMDLIHTTLATVLVDLQALGKATPVPTTPTTLASYVALLKSRIDSDYAASPAVTATKEA